MEEEWKPIEGYEGRYEISNFGRVRSLNYHREGRVKLLTPTKSKRGYYRLTLLKDGVEKSKPIHRLVALHFVDNPNPKEFNVVNHKDENPSNNIWTNLEWCTDEYNLNYGTAREKAAEKQKISVYKYSLQGELIKVYDSLIEASEDNNVSKTCISECCNGKQKTSGGFIFSHNELSVEDIELRTQKKKRVYQKKMKKRAYRPLSEEHKKNLSLSSPKRKEVFQYTLDGELVGKYDSIHEAAKCNNLCSGNISRCCRGQYKTYNGFIWAHGELPNK